VGPSLTTAQRKNHLRALEAESIYILRKRCGVCAAGHLYSIGKILGDAPARSEGIFPGKNSLPSASRRHKLQVSRNDLSSAIAIPKNWRRVDCSPKRRSAPRRGESVSLGTQKCCGLLKTKSLLDALSDGGFTLRSAARGVTKKSLAQKSASIPSAIHTANGTEESTAGALNIFNSRFDKGRSIRGVFSAVRIGLSSTSALHPYA